MEFKITLIAAMGRDRTIGLAQKMPWHLPEDLRHFKSRTLGKAMIMGRNTFESIGKPLPGRHTIIVSRTLSKKDFVHPECHIAASLKAAIAIAQDLIRLKQVSANEVMVVGGGQIYQQALPCATHMSLTAIDQTFNGDTFFPAWNSEDWQLVEKTEHKQSHEPYLSYSFEEFSRIKS